MSQDQYQYKIVTIGNSAVGKTSILSQICDKQFSQNFIATLGVDVKNHRLTIGKEKVKLTMWDTAGQERFRTITRNYYRDADGIIFAFSVTDQKSFKDIQGWIRQVQQFAPQNIVRILVGNKMDLEEKREVKRQEAKVTANNYSMQYKEVSAKTGENIEQMINQLTQMVHSKFKAKAIRVSKRIGEDQREPRSLQDKCCG